jgi:CBS domain-containing protein
MRDENISSVLLRCEPPAIVTDRDLRNRVLGEDLGPEVPAVRVCSRPLRTVAAATPLYEAWRTLLDAGVNHMPVVRDGEIIGVVTSTDLLRHSALGPVAVPGASSGSPPARRSPAGAKVTEMASALLAAGLDATVIAGFVAQLNGTVLRRLLHLAERTSARRPCRTAWIVFGPEARRERSSSPARRAPSYADEARARRWFQAPRAAVNGDLETAGFGVAPGADGARDDRHAVGGRATSRRRWTSAPGTLRDTSISGARGARSTSPRSRRCWRARRASASSCAPSRSKRSASSPR